MDKVQPIVITIVETGKRYELDFSRDTVRFCEARKFKIAEAIDFPATHVPDLFFYSFRKNHKNVSKAETDKILEKELKGLDGAFLERLGSLYNQAATSLVLRIDDDEDEESKNARVTVEL
jgi:hypothetical protein